MDEQHKLQQELNRTKIQFRATSAVVIVVLSVGTVFYKNVEKLDWLDSIYFCVVTLATVGYGDITPKTDAGKAFTIFYILIGVGLIATFASLLLKNASLRRDVKRRSANAKNTTH